MDKNSGKAITIVSRPYKNNKQAFTLVSLTSGTGTDHPYIVTIHPQQRENPYQNTKTKSCRYTRQLFVYFH
ncbi:hypothetical protein J18TS1_42270 [Oceanobacillus oncorhynchi subsp. incaldanensis]|nr:hypothetical protein J18TS1_42270 [Oceanobacillus oncorhynchi subsp. incaldanensis]